MVKIDGNHLKIEDIRFIADFAESIEISSQGKKNILASNKRLGLLSESEKPIYGINTGFGIFADKRIDPSESSKLSRNLILSHAVGTGEMLPDRVVRAAMAIRANTLSKGYSGVRFEIVQTLMAMLNKGVVPLIPSQGSLGSSGDLCQLSHLSLVFTTDKRDIEQESGQARYVGRLFSGKQAMKKAGISRIILGPKEGLALNNGATFSAAIAALTIDEALYYCDLADISLSLSLEALLGCSDAFDARIHLVRAHRGQKIVSDNVRNLIRKSTFINSTKRVQDAYSLRCAPQVHGAVRETIENAKQVVEIEINSATDNPLIFEDGDVLSGGNFHGEPIGLVMDYVGIALSELAAISERRVFRLTDGSLNYGLPPMLVDSFEKAGLNSGLMMLQYTSASLVLENQTLATPDSIHSLPTSGSQEDHNANAMTAARHAAQILNNVKRILAIELYTATRAIDLRKKQQPDLKLGVGTERIYKLIRSKVPYQAGDAFWAPEIDTVVQMIEQREIRI
jgi:histidine ammonia-lyase